MKTKTTPEVKEENKAVINKIKRTPFVHIEENGKKYIGCYRTRMETNDDIEEIQKKAKNLNWEMLGLYIEAIINEKIR